MPGMRLRAPRWRTPLADGALYFMAVVQIVLAAVVWFVPWSVEEQINFVGIAVGSEFYAVLAPFLTILDRRRRTVFHELIPAICMIVVANMIAAAVVMRGRVTVHGVDQVVTAGDALYFAVVSWTTLGYGDMSPTGFLKAYATYHAALGYAAVGLVVAMTVDAAATADVSTTQDGRLGRPRRRIVTADENERPSYGQIVKKSWSQPPKRSILSRRSSSERRRNRRRWKN